MGLRCLFLVVLATASLAPLTTAQQNVLLIVADDVGVDMVGAYGEHPLPATTPVINQLAADGLLFRNAWSLPTCSPSRAAMLTGRMPYQTGIGRAMYPVVDQYEVALAETTLPELLGPEWDTAAIGKWHMHSDVVTGITHPLDQGFDTHLGAPWNLPDPTPFSYFNFVKSIDGALTTSTTYATTDSVNDAIDTIAELQDPWFVWLAFNAPHTPFHNPPQALHSEDVPAEPGSDPPVAVRAMIEAMDTEIGRLLDSIDPEVLSDTLVIFVGDNGTHPAATTPPFNPAHAKASIFEGGINVPLIVSGRGVKKGIET
ncbi:MAG: sulfatase-like hydrolase/transferase, partial [Planctomycetota bacterium]